MVYVATAIEDPIVQFLSLVSEVPGEMARAWPRYKELFVESMKLVFGAVVNGAVGHDGGHVAGLDQQGVQVREAFPVS